MTYVPAPPAPDMTEKLAEIIVPSVLGGAALGGGMAYYAIPRKLWEAYKVMVKDVKHFAMPDQDILDDMVRRRQRSSGGSWSTDTGEVMTEAEEFKLAEIEYYLMRKEAQKKGSIFTEETVKEMRKIFGPDACTLWQRFPAAHPIPPGFDPTGFPDTPFYTPPESPVFPPLPEPPRLGPQPGFAPSPEPDPSPETGPGPEPQDPHQQPHDPGTGPSEPGPPKEPMTPCRWLGWSLMPCPPGDEDPLDLTTVAEDFTTANRSTIAAAKGSRREREGAGNGSRSG